MTFGILKRYVMGEVLRSFLLAVLTMTIIFVLFMVMAEATKMGLSPRDIAVLVPYIIPSTLPYTVPISMLFAVTVVYGRLASDNEVIAVKSAGLSAWTILWPAILMGAVLSAGLLYLSSTTIPLATHRAKLAIIKNFEDGFYKWLKIDRELNNPEWPFMIKVSNVDSETHTLYDPTFKHRAKKGTAPHTYDMTVQARTAKVYFDLEKSIARVYLDGATITPDSKADDVVLVNNQFFDMDLPEKGTRAGEVRIQERTTTSLSEGQAKIRELMARERARQAMSAALWIGSGRLERVDWVHTQEAFRDYAHWSQQFAAFETEKQQRVAQSFGSLVFVLLGAPVGILFARRDFLSAFISCFIPIILLYYPLMLLGINLGKEGQLNPIPALWSGNALLCLLSLVVYPRVLKH